MRRRDAILLALCALISIILQGNVLRGILPAGALVPNLLLIIVVFLAYRHSSSSGAVAAFSVGLMFDICSGGRIGPWAGSFVFLYGWLSYLTQRFLAESGFSVLVVVFIASLIASILAIILASDFGISSGLIFQRALIEALFTALCAPLVFPILQRFLKFSQSSGTY